VLPSAACATNAINAPTPSPPARPVYARAARITLIPWARAIPDLGYATLRPHEHSHEYCQPCGRFAAAPRGARHSGVEHDRGRWLPGAPAVSDRELQPFRPVPADRPP